MYSSFTLQQTHILDCGTKDASWLFEVVENGNTHYWSDTPKSYNGNDYTFKITSFSPIKLSLIDGHAVGLNEMDIVLDNPLNALATVDYTNAVITVRLLLSANLQYRAEDFTCEDFTMESDVQEAEIRTFCFEVHGEPINLLQQMHLKCRGWLERYLNGDYPNTSLISDLWPSESNDGEDNSCIPVIWGTAFIPVPIAYITDGLYYLLGPYSGTYNITKIVSPREYESKSTWLESAYSFTESSKAGSDGNNYSAWVFEIAASSDGDGSADSNGVFKVGERWLPIPCQYSWSGTSSMTALPNIIEYFLEDLGCPSAKIDDTSKAAVTTKHTSWSVEYSGGFWYKRDRQEILKELLAQGHMYILQRDKLYFNYYDKTSKLSLEKWHMKGSFTGDTITDQYSINRLDVDGDHDSAYVAYQKAGRCIDLLHKVKTTYKSGISTPSGDCVNMPFLHDSQDAKKMGTLFFQRDKKRHSTHRQVFNERILQLECGDTTTINPTDYDGGGFAAVIQTMSINNDVSIDVDFVSYSCALDNFEDVSASAVTIVADDSENVFQRPTTGPDTPGQTGNNRPNAMKGNRWVIPDGKDLIFEASATDIGGIILRGTSYDIYFNATRSGNKVWLYPEADGDNVVDLLIGNTYDDSPPIYDNRFKNIILTSSEYTEIASGSRLIATKNFAKVKTMGDNDEAEPYVEIYLQEKSVGNEFSYYFLFDEFYPGVNKGADCGTSSYAWDDVY